MKFKTTTNLLAKFQKEIFTHLKKLWGNWYNLVQFRNAEKFPKI